MNWLEQLGGKETVIQGVLSEFEGFCAIPHPSWGEAELSAALYQRFQDAGLQPETDAAHNLMVELSATRGCEEAPTVILQGHLDMVCAVAPGSGWDPQTDRVHTAVSEGWLRSDGRSSLGADNNLGNATVLWLLNQKVPHGPVRLIFTVAEEVGLEGAKRVSPKWLEGAKYLVNTDGFHFGRVVVGSAGGRRETFSHSLIIRPSREGEGRILRLAGFAGGHSGDDIHRDRCNPLQILAGFLQELDLPYAIGSFSGGQGLNVIPSEACAHLLLRKGDGVELAHRVEGLRLWLRGKYGNTDPDQRVELVLADAPAQVWTPACAHEVLHMVTGLHHGVVAWHADFPEVPSASANAARLWVEDEQLKVGAFLRCTTRDQEERLVLDHKALARSQDFSAQATGYPGWAGDKSNPLALLMAEAFREQTGEEAELTAVHVGLEPSILGSKAPELVMAVSGPDIVDAHSTKERASLETLPCYAAFLAGTLEKLGQLREA